LPPKDINAEAPLPREGKSHFDLELLLQSARQNVHSARERRERSHKIVAHSREIIARMRRTMAHSLQIQEEPGRGIPLIPKPKPGRG